MTNQCLPEAVNYHLNKNCNFRCRGCYATFSEDPFRRGIMLPKEQMFAVVTAVAEAPLPHGKPFRKLTFAGGEPTLCPWLPELIAHAKSCGLITMLVTNGSRCDEEYLQELADNLDWLTLSIDSLNDNTNLAIGRHNGKGEPLSARDYSRILTNADRLGLRTKINTVVNRLNWQEDMSGFLGDARIERWKVLQVMPVEGQNDDHIEALTINRGQFDAYIHRHQSVSSAGVRVVPEPVTSIRGSYAMIDPKGCFFDSSAGHHTYSQPILEAGIASAFAEVSFDSDLFEQRGGSYDFGLHSGELSALTSPDIPLFGKEQFEDNSTPSKKAVPVLAGDATTSHDLQKPN